MPKTGGKMTRHKITKPAFVNENTYLLAEERQRKELTQKELAELLGINFWLIKHYEQGYQIPCKAIYNKLADFFDWQKWEFQS